MINAQDIRDLVGAIDRLTAAYERRTDILADRSVETEVIYEGEKSDDG